jgi:hypothetical protein
MSAELDLLKKEAAMLKYRCMSAELALYEMTESLRKMAEVATQVVQQVHRLNGMYPLGDTSLDGVARVTIEAIRASVPGASGLSDAEIKATYLSPVQPPKE